MVGYWSLIGPSALAAGVLLWLLRRRKPPCRSKVCTKSGNNCEPIISPDSTGAEATLLRNSQDVELYLRIWRSKVDEVINGVVILQHSYSQDSEHFTEFAEVLSSNNFTVLAFDMQSHGLSGTSTGQRGDVYRYQDLVNDLNNVFQFAKREFPELPIFLFGEGFGGTIGLQFCLTHDSDLEGIILCSPMVVSTTKEGNSMFSSSSKLDKTKSGLQVNGSDLNKIDKPTDRFFSEAQHCLEQLEVDLDKLKIPFLILHRNLDTQTASFNSQELFTKSSSADKKLMIYEDMYSQLFQESPEKKERVFQDILKWLKDRTKLLITSRGISTADLTIPSQEPLATTKPSSPRSPIKRQESFFDRFDYNGY